MFDEKRLRLIEERIPGLKRTGKDDDQRKTYDEVFDQRTLLLIAKLINDGVLSTVDYPVATGKEGNVFHATTPEGGAVALKIYRVNTATFKNIIRYIEGDSRFKHVRKTRRDVIEAWARKEYKNLMGMAAAGARVPKALAQRSNVLVMSYVGDEGQPAPELRHVTLEDPVAAYEDLVGTMKTIRKAGLVHGDLSEYNVLVWDGQLWVIDCGQAVPLEHGQAEEWFKRDCANVARYFRRLGVETSAEALEKEVRG
ncbi:MAG: hypothetical protein A3K65_02510 [Euryarchaeota archaeon RBG_16_68_12]|nr:MAG: hypothetical protein A3K65_02510 [Euryarchaeota archaeon RBG_16_68_12]